MSRVVWISDLSDIVLSYIDVFHIRSIDLWEAMETIARNVKRDNVLQIKQTNTSFSQKIATKVSEQEQNQNKKHEVDAMLTKKEQEKDVKSQQTKIEEKEAQQRDQEAK